MIADGIVIRWDDVDEYIQISPERLTLETDITSTKEWWPQTKSVITYNACSEINFLADCVEISIWYRHSANLHINQEDARWGKSVITIKHGSDKGKAVWYDAEQNSGYDGTVRWETVKTGLFKADIKETVLRKKRNQEMFRAALFSCQNGCAITNESTAEVLEAAHIIPSKNNGSEVIENGMLLRADLHRLYDAGKFKIDPDGRITDLSPDLSNTYREILAGVQLPREVTDRISEALLHQWSKE
jgi:putative restriction endonuclease